MTPAVFSLQYDTVLNKQRVEVYDTRRAVLRADDRKVFSAYFTDADIATLGEREGDNADRAARLTVLRNIDIAWMETPGTHGLREEQRRTPILRTARNR